MTDLNLEVLELQGARFVNIIPGTKRPVGTGWQHRGCGAAQITTPGAGMLLGEVSGGIGALDFDGSTACEFWREWQGEQLPDTVMWSSGGFDRFQMAIQIPPEYWSTIPTKFALKTGDGEQLEWRWGNSSQGFQSVLPPSVHPSGRVYHWLPDCSPVEVPVFVATPEWIEIISVLAGLAQPPSPVVHTSTTTEPSGETITEKRALELILLEIQQMRAGDRSVRACRVGGLMKFIRPMLHSEIIQRLQAAGCDRSAIASARKYSSL